MTVLILYLLILTAVFLLQRKMLYFPARFTPELQQELANSADLQPWPSANNLLGWISKSLTVNTKGTILIFQGNAGAAVYRAYYIDALQQLGYRVIIAEYPGYGLRSGDPSEKVLVSDGINTARMVLSEFKEPLFLCGESLGSGVVGGIVASKQVPVKGLLLITPFDAMTEVAQHHYWFLLARWLLLDKFDNIANLQDFRGPIAVLIAGKDEVIPNRRTMALFDALPPQKKLWRFEHAGHNSIPMEPSQPWWQEAIQFLEQ